MKRKAAGGVLQETSKRQAVELPRSPPIDDESPYNDTSVFSGDDRVDDSPIRDLQTPSTTSVTSAAISQRGRRTFPSDLKTIQCPHCPKAFNRPARLTAHLRSHNGDRPFACTTCGSTYREEKHLTQHVKSAHSEERKYICEVEGCGKAFLTGTRLRRHASVHEGAERYRCRDYERCSQTFRKKATLERHVRSAHLGLAPYPCSNDGCTDAFQTPAALRRHVSSEHGSLQFWCDLCAHEEGDDGEPRRVGFTTWTMLETHIKKNHRNCMFCDKTFGSRSALDLHVENAHGSSRLERRKTFSCSEPGCGKTYTRAQNLEQHIATAHLKRRFVCGQVDPSCEELKQFDWSNDGCGAQLTTLQNLKNHIKYTHLGMQRPQLEHDPLSSMARTNAEDLTNVDSRRNIPCDVCGARFIRYPDLHKHQEKQHALPHEQSSQAIMTASEVPTHHTYPTYPVIDPQLRQAGDGMTRGDVWPSESAQVLSAPSGFEPEWGEMRMLIDEDVI